MAKNIITITLNPDEMILAHIKQEFISIASRTYAPHQVHAYEKINFTNNEFYNAHIFNMKFLVEQTTNFIKKNRITSPICALAVEGPTVKEVLAYHESPDAPTSEEKIPENIQFIGKNIPDNNYVSYRCAIPAEHVWQYNLFALLIGTTMAELTTISMARIRAFIYKRGTALLPAQPTGNLTLVTYLATGLKSYELINHVKPIRELKIDYVNEEQNLITHFGLYLRGKESHE